MGILSIECKALPITGRAFDRNEAIALRLSFSFYIHSTRVHSIIFLPVPIHSIRVHSVYQIILFEFILKELILCEFIL